MLHYLQSFTQNGLDNRRVSHTNPIQKGIVKEENIFIITIVFIIIFITTVNIGVIIIFVVLVGEEWEGGISESCEDAPSAGKPCRLLACVCTLQVVCGGWVEWVVFENILLVLKGW